MNLLHERDEESLLSSSPCLAVPPALPPPHNCIPLSQDNLEGPSFVFFVGLFSPPSFVSLMVFTSQPVETFLPSPKEQGEEKEGPSTGSRRTHKLLLPFVPEVHEKCQRQYFTLTHMSIQEELVRCGCMSPGERKRLSGDGGYN